MVAGLMKLDTGGLYTEHIEGLTTASAKTEVVILGPCLCTVVIYVSLNYLPSQKYPDTSDNIETSRKIISMFDRIPLITS
jgi:hypothetical protein